MRIILSLTGRRLLAALALLLLAGAGGGLLVAWSGVASVSARAGHWGITRWILDFGMQNAVETHALLIDTPALDEAFQVPLGLGHYEGGCAPCHGAPGEPRNPIMLQAVPKPPFLADEPSRWKPRELFWIVANGLKYTGMPGWPAAERDDEVWAVVAALLRLQELDGAEYRRLVRHESLLRYERVEEDARLIAAAGAVGEDLVACGRCHGLRGEGGGDGAFPALAAQSEEFLYQALQSYALGARPSGIMQPVAAALAESEMRELARYFAALPAASGPMSGDDADPELLALGRSVATGGHAAAGVPACAACHGPKSTPLHPLHPTLSGQAPAYLERQLRLWRRGIFDGTAQARVMSAAARSLTDEQIRAVSLFYASHRADAPALASAAAASEAPWR